MHEAMEEPELPELIVTRPPDHPGVLVATMNRPPVNATTTEFFQILIDFFQSVGKDPAARCVILTARGRLFCAGADVKKLNDRTTESAFFRSEVSRACFDSIRRCAIPVISAVNGGALGSGVVLASSCDMMVMAENAYFALPEVDVGAMGGTRHSARVLSDKLVRYMALTGRRVSAQTLLAMGGANEVVPADRLMDTAFDLADCIARKGPMVVRMMKESINLTEDFPVTEGYRVEQLYTTLASAMDEAKEASAAFLEKRDPKWVTELKE
jgi:enoyl-CoA hydratase